mgnify:CR=1 FL=1
MGLSPTCRSEYFNLKCMVSLTNEKSAWVQAKWNTVHDKFVFTKLICLKGNTKEIICPCTSKNKTVNNRTSGCLQFSNFLKGDKRTIYCSISWICVWICVLLVLGTELANWRWLVNSVHKPRFQWWNRFLG